MYTNSNFWSFKSTTLRGTNGANSFGDETWSSLLVPTGSISTVGFKDDTRCVGACGINVYAEGLESGGAATF